MTKTTTTTKEYDADGRLVKETVVETVSTSTKDDLSYPDKTIPWWDRTHPPVQWHHVGYGPQLQNGAY